MVNSPKCYEKSNCLYCGEPTTKGICEKCTNTEPYDYSIVHDKPRKNICSYVRKERRCPNVELVYPRVNVYEGDIITYNGRIKATRFDIWKAKRRLRLMGVCKFMIGYRCYKEKE